jgi:putative salt-induced outer membrane protein YdiY
VQSAKHTLTADLSGGYATDKRTAGSGKSSAIAGAGALYKWKVSETADFIEDARFVGAVPQGSDWRLTNSASLAAKVSSLLSLKVSNTVRYVNLPVVGFTDTDVQTSIALVAKF